jgi:hypothetical protein
MAFSIRNKLGVAGVSEEKLANDERVKDLIDGEITSTCGKN